MAEKLYHLGCDHEFVIDSLSTNTTGVIRNGGPSRWLALGLTAGRVGAKFMFDSVALTGTSWGMQIRSKISAAHANNAVASAVGLNVSASSAIASASGLQAIQGYTQPGYAQAGTTCINTALYGCSDHPTTVDVLARTWTLWVDCHCDVVSSGGQYLARFSNNANPSSGTGAAITGLFTVYQGTGLGLFCNVENDAGGAGFVGTQTGVTTAAKHFKCKIAGTTYYIPLCTGTT